MWVVNSWTNASPSHELNSDVFGTSLDLQSHIYDRHEIFSLDSDGSHPQRSFHALCVCMTIPMSLLQFYHAAYGIPFCCSSVFSAITCPPDLHYHSILRGTFQFSAVWHTLEGVEVQNHPVLVWLTLDLKTKNITNSKTNHLRLCGKPLPGSSTNPAPASVLYMTLWYSIQTFNATQFFSLALNFLFSSNPIPC